MALRDGAMYAVSSDVAHGWGQGSLDGALGDDGISHDRDWGEYGSDCAGGCWPHDGGFDVGGVCQEGADGLGVRGAGVGHDGGWLPLS